MLLANIGILNISNRTGEQHSVDWKWISGRKNQYGGWQFLLEVMS